MNDALDLPPDKLAALERRLEAEQTRRLAKTDLEVFAREYLKIRAKSGETRPLIFNEAQRRLHEMLERQLAETGRVRAVVLKARQMGVSTYVAARFYHKTTHRPVLAR
jgi:hypothetical protein